ncbi:MAG: hypothetical protein AAF363_07625 [Bacteroidota bacterium]
MDLIAYIIIALIYLSAMAFTVHLLMKDYFGYASFAGPFISFPIATVLSVMVLSLMSIEFDFLGYIYYIMGGFAAYSVLTLLITLIIMPKVKVHKVKVKGIKTNATELSVFDENACPTGEKIPVSALLGDISQMTFILQVGRHYVAYAPDQYNKPYFYPRGLYVDPNYLEFEGDKKLKGKRFTQYEKAVVIKEIEVDITGLKKGVGQITLLNKSGERLKEVVDREDFYDLVPNMGKVKVVNGKALISIPVDGSWRKAIHVSSEHLVFDSKADKERIEKLKEYKKYQV